MGQLNKELFPELKDIPQQYNVDRLDQRAYFDYGTVKEWNGPMQEVLSPIMIRDTAGNLTQRSLGSYPLMDGATSLQVLESAVKAYAKGASHDTWPTMSVRERIEHTEMFVSKMAQPRNQVINYLMWEIGKSLADSTKEYDRTVKYILDTVEDLKKLNNTSSIPQKYENVLGIIKYASLGVATIQGPFNYALNETYTLFIPSTIMGNTGVMKPARYGVLLHYPLMEAYKCFPPGVINIAYGDGQEIITPLMKSGEIKLMEFIGSESTANKIINNHPNQSKLETILGLNAKNPAIVLKSADMDITVDECVSGSLSYNGQRCTALKILFVHKDVVDDFVSKFSEKVDKLKIGMPWVEGVKITPMPDLGTVERMHNYVNDAVTKGAKVVNRGSDSLGTLFNPAVLFPVAKDMLVYQEEQFGPVVPIVPFSDIQEPIEYMINSDFGQQASIFGDNPEEVGKLIDVAANQVCRTNLNGQCMRGPDAYPFTGRKSSAKKILSIRDALLAFSIPSMVGANDTPANKDLIRRINEGRYSKFLQTDFLF
jgi:glyceraldehyde-3-phosphate dehydrogenase (NADP+)